MPLIDLGRPAELTSEGVVFLAVSENDVEVRVQIERAALRSVGQDLAGDLDRFNAYRGIFGEAASDKFDAAGIQADGRLSLMEEDLESME